MKYLVTGSCGFIGSNFVRKFYNFSKIKSLNASDKICSIDKMEQDFTKYNYYINKNHSFYLGDVTDKVILNNIFEIEKPDCIIHFAADSHVDASIDSPSSFVKNNVYGAQVLLDAAVKYNIKKFVYISTDEVYGQLQKTDSQWTEESVPNPRNPYSASKLSAEYLVKAAHETFGLNYLITRSCNNFGPRQSTKNLIPKIIKSIYNNQKMPIYGDGKQMREWIYVEDNCSALMTIINSNVINETFNISSNNETSNIELFNNIADLMGKGHNLIEYVKDRPGHDFRYSISANKLKALGWEPSNNFLKLLEKTVKWYLDNEWLLKC